MLNQNENPSPPMNTPGESSFRAFFEQSADAYLILDGNTFTDCNQAAVQMLRAKSKSDVLATHPAELSPEFQPDGRPSGPKADEMIQIALETGSHRFEWVHRRLDGEDFPVEVLLTPIITGEKILIYTTWRDISERKKALALSEQLNAVIQFSPDAIFTVSPQGRITTWNPAAERIFEYTPEEILGKPALILAPPEVQEDAKQTIMQLMQGKKLPTIETVRVTKSGKRLQVLVRSVVLKDQYAKVLGIGVSIQDITERKRLEMERQELFERRGYQVQISTEISQEIAQATELSDLFRRVVTLTKERLNYYHSQLLRYDPAQDAVVLIAGYGEIGAKMFEMGHKMPLGSGLIGVAAETGETVMRPNLSEDPDWHSNPLLPETRGEIAVPIKLGDEILGVLDIQSNQVNAITDDDRLLLEGICGQIAIAMEQTRLRQEIETRLDEINRLYRAVRREGWAQYQATVEIPEAVQYDQAGVYVLSEPDLTDELFAKVELVLPGGDALGELAIADDPENPLSQAEKVFLEQVSGQVALALENARLFNQTQEALTAIQENEQQLAEAMRIANMAHWEMDLTTFEFIVNDRLLEMLRLSEEKFGGYRIPTDQYIQQYIYPDDAHILSTAIQDALHSPDPENYHGRIEYRLVRADGEIRDIVSDYRLEVNAEGQPVRAFGSFLDITERKQAEQALREAQDRAQTILETISLPMVITRLADNVLTFINEPALEVVQIAYDDAINQPAPEFYYNPEEREQFIKELQEKGRVSNMEVQLLRSDGKPFWALLSARSFNYRGEPSILTAFSDITDRIQAQEAVARRAAELATVAEIGTTISTILEEQQLLETIVQVTQRRFNLYHCHIFILDENSQNLQMKACGWEEGSPHVGTHGTVEIAIDEEKSLVAQAVRSRYAVIINDVRSDPNWLPNELLPNTRSEMAVPIIVGEQVLGVLDVQAKTVDRFDEADISIMTTLASQMAVALQNARTYKQTQQQAEYEAMINQISQRIQSTTSVENALQVAVRELGRALGAKRANIQLGLPTQTGPKSS